MPILLELMHDSQSILFSACPCENNGVCLGKDDDANLQEDCDCSRLFNFEGPTCGVATGNKLFLAIRS